MKRRSRYYSFFGLILLLFALLNMPSGLEGALRYHSAHIGSLISAPWRGHEVQSEEEREIARLRMENLALKQQIDFVKQWLLNEERIEGLLERLETCFSADLVSLDEGEFLRRRSRDVIELLGRQFYSCQASVIFRDVSSWSSQLWINRGRRDNEKLGREIIAKQSPVVVGSSVIGVIEYVGERQSRVRLITDRNLTPSVRVFRGDEKSGSLVEKIDYLTERMEAAKEFEKSTSLIGLLKEYREKLVENIGSSYLAKGYLFGASQPLWRSKSMKLKGVGFNYDFDDEEGEARDLRYGTLFSKSGKVNPEVLLKNGDLLVTTGMDGIFPPGLSVATVTNILPLKEGGYAYDLEAMPTAGDLNELVNVLVLPPTRFDPKDVPSDELLGESTW